MRSSGTLRSWNDARGFGVIAPAQGGPELFVHVSAFPQDGSKPTVGETVYFQHGHGPDGRPRAVQVTRSVVGNTASLRKRPPVAVPAKRAGSSLWGSVLLIVVLIAGGAWGYRHFQQASHRRQLESMPAVTPQPMAAPAEPAMNYRCDGRTHCSQMTSCAEATWFINHCPGTQMDGNHDGVPCEQQWCTAPGAR